MIEESIAQNTRWVVFEPNDVSLWKAIRRDVSAFLMSLWRDGALMGATPEEAFFVKCDAETNPPEVIDQGRVVIVIGVAPVKPAEFVIFRIGQHASGAEIA
jgi:phage tail sheath protein FI